ncbi:MAG TPA: FKBP-type peptidyl-prolyl cis-trans isomerase [Saprospiraceae bacterium]|nr:FKBP-type peptidyl-prolyl cis-trans isomerase [Saprospiraceae bacterium]HPI07507.1 FKBP-type peptidyl-prolyl cis-trans isomerase [Saprospiraceae bacterium]
MKELFLSLTILVTLLPTALQSQSTGIVTTHGYRFINHTNKRSKQPQIGESVSARVDVRAGKTLLSSSRKSASGLYIYDLPDTSTVNHVPPVVEAALLMGLGDSVTIYQKIDDYMKQFIPEESRNEKEIAFQIVLVGIQSVEEKQRAAQAAREQTLLVRKKVEATVQDYTMGRLDSRIIKTKSGLKILVETPGQGLPVVKEEAVQVHYFGFLTDGTSFDNSFERHEPITFPVGVGQMIPGFDEGVLQLRHGSKAYLFIPPALGYGEETPDSIPANAELVFYIEIL